MNERTKPRVLIQKEVTINGLINAFGFDLNEEGMYLQTDVEFRQNDIVTVDFEIEGRQLSIKAAVRHIEPGFGFGVKFVNLSPDYKTTLARFLKISGAAESNLKIALIIDGNSQTRAVYKTRLNHDGFNVIEATNGSEAFKVLQLTKPDIVVLDIQIEGISAYKILQYMQTKEELKCVPTLMLATRFIPEEAQKLLSLGCKDYLIKGTTTPKIFSEKVHKMIHKT
ncbi:MAG: response regulator [Nitrospirae bacterium]|nr:response regulator [Nitrospirota bacterium]